MSHPFACPACLDTSARPILRVDAAQAAQHFVHRRQDAARNAALADHVRTLWNGDTADIHECGRCGFGFARPFVAGDATFYNLASPRSNYPRTKWEFSRTLEALAAVKTAGCTALEVGAGRGYFLDHLAERTDLRLGDVSAIEYDEDALQVLRAKGVTTYAEDVRTDAFAQHRGAFDFLFLFQVVEHLDRVDALFARLAFLLKPEGSIFIAVPNKRRTDYQERHGSQLDMPPNHIGRWTPEAFAAVCARHGLRIGASETEPFDAVAFLKQDIAYSFVQHAQTSSGLAGVVRGWPRSPAARLAMGAVAAARIPTRLPAWRAAFADKDAMGGALWLQVHHR